jgi:hypothetical protein
VNWAWRAMVPSGPSVREVPDVTMGDHFGRVAAVYESLRTTDEAPVRASGQFLPDGTRGCWASCCRTGRCWPQPTSRRPCWPSSRPASAATPRGWCRAAAEELPLRAASLDLVTAFNYSNDAADLLFLGGAEGI